MPSTLRLRLTRGAAALVALGVLCHGLATYVTYHLTQLGGGIQTQEPANVTFLVVLTTIGTFCIAVAVVMAAGIVASLVVEEGLERRLWMHAGFDDDDDTGESDPDAH